MAQELKAGVLVTPHNEGMCFHRGSDSIGVTENETEFYLKSEADKVIAELEMKLAIAQQVLRLNKPEALYSNLETMSRLTHEKYVIERRERHHKYKRCLAMAKWCEYRWTDIATQYYKSVLYRKWQLRWLELAEKFKEAK